MGTIYYARGDSSTANNAELNVEGTNKIPLTTLEFVAGSGGDIILDYNGGLPDPDTTVLVNGVEQTFTVEFSGTLPLVNKISDVAGSDLRGEQVVVITTQSGERLFFLPSAPDATVMDAIKNGALSIDNVDTTTNQVICFAEGTAIATSIGDVPVQALQPGDHVLTADGRSVPILWVHETYVSGAELARNPALRPVVIPKGTFGAGKPFQDLAVSPQHRLLFSGWTFELHFGTPDVLVRALHLMPVLAHQIAPARGVRYFHILCENHEMLISNGLASESYQPSEIALDAIGVRARASFAATFPPEIRDSALTRADAFATLKRHESAVLAGSKDRTAA